MQRSRECVRELVDAQVGWRACAGEVTKGPWLIQKIDNVHRTHTASLAPYSKASRIRPIQEKSAITAQRPCDQVGQEEKREHPN